MPKPAIKSNKTVLVLHRSTARIVAVFGGRLLRPHAAVIRLHLQTEILPRKSTEEKSHDHSNANAFLVFVSEKKRLNKTNMQLFTRILFVFLYVQVLLKILNLSSIK